jgi:hypothetical protein
MMASNRLNVDISIGYSESAREMLKRKLNLKRGRREKLYRFGGNSLPISGKILYTFS